MGAISTTITPETAPEPAYGTLAYTAKRLAPYLGYLARTIEADGYQAAPATGAKATDHTPCACCPSTRDIVRCPKVRRLVYADMVGDDGAYAVSGPRDASCHSYVSEERRYRLWLSDSLSWAIEEFIAGRYLYAFRGFAQACGYAGRVQANASQSDALGLLKNALEDVISKSLAPDGGAHTIT